MKGSFDSNNRFKAGFLLLSLILVITISCTKSMSDMTGNGNGTGDTGTPGANEVWIQGMAFTPSTITVTAGTTITWTNKDAAAHTVSSLTSLFNSGSVGTGGTYSHQFNTVGSFPYVCSFHPSMTGTVVVN